MKVSGRTYSYVVTKAEDGGYLAKCIELPQVHTEGETLSEVKKNMRDAPPAPASWLSVGRVIGRIEFCANMAYILVRAVVGLFLHH